MALPGLPIWRLVRAGYKVIAYSYKLSIATASPEITITNLNSILKNVDERIKKIDQNVGISCFGTSMGTVLAVAAAARHERIQKVILNLSYSQIATHIQNLPPMWFVPPYLLRKYIAKSGGPDGLHAIFDQYSPVSLASNLNGKSILLYRARKDRILRYADTTELAFALSRAGARVTYYENASLGHYFGSLLNHLRFNRYMDFLADSSISTAAMKHPKS